MSTNTRAIVDSFNLAHRFAVLGHTEQDNGLLPRKYKRVHTPYMKQNRRADFAVSYGGTNLSYEFPQSMEMLDLLF